MHSVSINSGKRRSFEGATILFSFTVIYLLSCSSLFALTETEVGSAQKEISDLPIGERVAFWAEKFVGVPYDPDPLGEYVRQKAVIADDRVDCMYLTFRALELAAGRTPEESVRIALDKRFITQGILEGGVVTNYEERFQYGEDMIDSGKWGREITAELGPLTFVRGTRGRDKVGMLSKETLLSVLRERRDAQTSLRSGDFIFFIKSPDKRVVDEIVGHIGIVKEEKDGLFLIHAGGKKSKGGMVKKVSLSDYLNSMPFAGVRVSRY